MPHVPTMSILSLAALLIALVPTPQCTAQQQPIASGIVALQSAISLAGISGPLAASKPVPAPAPVLAPGQDVNDPSAFLLYNADAVHYPFTIHLPDRKTRNLAPLSGRPPLLLSLSGSGARGNSSVAIDLSGYDGASRKISQYYNKQNHSSAHCAAAEEFLTVVPISPLESAQADANWDVKVLPNILAQVNTIYPFDTTRIYLSGYSMGGRACWWLLQQNPNLFAGSIISAGSQQSTNMTTILGNSIRAYYAIDDEDGLAADLQTTQVTWLAAQKSALTSMSGSLAISRTTSRKLEVVGPIPAADHLTMTEKPWNEEVVVDGYAGALAWLLTQSRSEGATLPNYDPTVCTTCIPAGSCVPGKGACH